MSLRMGANKSRALSPGVIIDEQYELVEELPRVAGRPRFRARDLATLREVDLIVTGKSDGKLRYRVRGVEADSKTPPASRRIVLTEKVGEQGSTLIYAGWDREARRQVRVTVEPVGERFAAVDGGIPTERTPLREVDTDVDAETQPRARETPS